jgi:tryptophan 2,3-dioxygenase
MAILTAWDTHTRQKARARGCDLPFTHSCDTLFYVEVAMETRNITLSIPKEVLLKVKLIAVKRQTSVSGLLTQTLEKLVEQEDAYAHARKRHLQRLEQGVDLGTGGQILTQRDELHERT